MKKKKENTMTETTNIYKLGLHENIEIKIAEGTYRVTRVPGGWLYHTTKYSIDSGITSTDTFVPLNFEFQKESKND